MDTSPYWRSRCYIKHQITAYLILKQHTLHNTTYTSWIASRLQIWNSKLLLVLSPSYKHYNHLQWQRAASEQHLCKRYRNDRLAAWPDGSPSYLFVNVYNIPWDSFLHRELRAWVCFLFVRHARACIMLPRHGWVRAWYLGLGSMLCKLQVFWSISPSIWLSYDNFLRFLTHGCMHGSYLCFAVILMTGFLAWYW